MEKINFINGNYYHICNRAVAKSRIFLDIKDYLHFLLCLKEFNTTEHIEFRVLHLLKKRKDQNPATPQTTNTESSLHSSAETPQPNPPLPPQANTELIKIISYALFPDHFHIILKQVREDGIPFFMQKLGTGYAMYSNTRYKTSGHIFGGKYLAEVLNSPEHILFISTFMHLHPLKKGLAKIFHEKFSQELFEKNKNSPWSSFSDYLNIISSSLDLPELRRVKPPIEKEYALSALAGNAYEGYSRKFWKEKNKYPIKKSMM